MGGMQELDASTASTPMVLWICGWGDRVRGGDVMVLLLFVSHDRQFVSYRPIKTKDKTG